MNLILTAAGVCAIGYVVAFAQFTTGWSPWHLVAVYFVIAVIVACVLVGLALIAVIGLHLWGVWRARRKPAAIKPGIRGVINGGRK